MKYLPALLLLLLCGTRALAQTEAQYLANPTAGNLNMRYAFRDVPFETDTAHVAGLRLMQRGDISYYVRPAEKPIVNGARVGITYGFIQGRFATLTLAAATHDDAAKLLAALTGLYGQEDLVSKQYRELFPARHQWTAVRATLRYEETLSGATATMVSTALMQRYDKQQAARAKLAAGEL